jgi:hypothetical protein
MIRIIIYFVLIYVVFRLIRVFIANFKLGAKRGDNIDKDIKPNSTSRNKYENVEEADFTEIESKEENHKK